MADEKVKVSSLVTVAPKTTDKVLITTTDDSGQLQTRNALLSDIRNLAASLEDSEDKAINVKIANEIVKKVTDLASEVDTSFETVNQNFTNVNNAISKNRDNITTANENMTAHEEDTDLHVTAEKQQKWDGYDQSIKDVKEIADNNTTQLKEKANPNLLLNGGPEIWQRGTSFTAFGYTADRWIYDISGDDDGIVTKHADGGLQMKLVSNQRIYLMQRLELTKELKSLLANKTVTISFDVSTSAGVNINPYVRIWHPGNGGHETKKAYNENANEVEKRIQCQLDVGDLSADDWLGIDIFRIDDTNKLNLSDNLFIRFKNIKLELGSVATPFIPRPYGEELALCQRYYYRWGNERARYRAVGINGNQLFFFVPLPTTLRIIPTINNAFSINTLSGAGVSDFTFAVNIVPMGMIVHATKSTHGMSDGQLMLSDDGSLDAEIY